MKESFTLKGTFPASPEQIYQTWLNSESHAAMTSGGADISDRLGASFSARNGYIGGQNLELTPPHEIVQSWRTVEFSVEDEDSKLIIRLKAIEEGTELPLIHENIPSGQTQYKQGWGDNYFIPMQSYFERLNV